MAVWQPCVPDFFLLTKLDNCGRPLPPDVPGSRLVVSGQTVSFSATDEIEAGEEILKKGIKGEKCLYRPACDTIKYENIEWTLCPTYCFELFQFISDSAIIPDPNNAALVRGMSFRQLSCKANFSLEAWAENCAENPCDDDGTVNNVIRMIFPKITKVTISRDGAFEAGNVPDIKIMMQGETNENWFPPLPNATLPTYVPAVTGPPFVPASWTGPAGATPLPTGWTATSEDANAVTAIGESYWSFYGEADYPIDEDSVGCEILPVP